LDLTHLFPQPIEVDFAGRRVLARPLRLRQLAALQAWLNAALPDPSGPAASAIAAGGQDDEARRRLLVGAYAEAEAWPVRVGSPAGDFALDRWGRAAFLTIALAEHNPGLAGDDFGRLARSAEPGDWPALMRAAFGPFDPGQAIARMIDPEAFTADDDRADREPPDWCALVVQVMHDAGWTFEQAGELTPGQLAAYRTKCAPADFDVPPRPGESREQANARRRAYFDLDGDGSDDDGDG
jgi:hypothetical protein